MLFQLRQFLDTFQTELVNKNSYKARIDRMRLRLLKLQKSDPKAWKIRTEGLEGYEEIDEMLHHQGLPFVLKII